MREFYLVSTDGRILNVVAGDNLTRERAVAALHQGLNEYVTETVTIEQLREYERSQH